MKKWDLTLPSLHKTFADYFKVGNIFSVYNWETNGQPNDWDNPGMLEMYRHHYNVVSPGNAMKPVYISSAPGVYHFQEADRLVAWANENHMAVIAHTLVWHGQSADWLNKTPTGTPLPRAQAKANLHEFIKRYVSRYSGKVYAWDVINEAFVDRYNEPYSGNWRDYIRRESDNPMAVGHWFLAYANGAAPGECGTDFVFDAFYYARKYDPAAILSYNDYNEHVPNKRDAIAQMTEEINAKWQSHPEYDGRLLIERIGMQSHYNHLHYNITQVQDAMDRFIKTGANISITELDITFGSPEEPSNPLTPEESARQAQMYAELFALYKKYAAHIDTVTIWGKNDHESWRNWGAPTLFDNNCAAKESFYSIAN
ncbi:MAG: endo-1,4-beta-xylanase [Defluviitaleaceae bacterium]|nr:endo-1,4-beta-xylanase [Defluviitaleaceae bacterium]